MKVYMYSFFDREQMFFHNVLEVSKGAADQRAWSYFKEALRNYKDDEQIIDSCTATTKKEFLSNDYNYINLADIGGLECQYEEREI